MNPFTKRHGRLSPPGTELRILRLLPRATVAAALALAGLSVFARLVPADPGADAQKAIRAVDYFAIATGITLLTAVVTVAIGCVIVHIMKGPAYVADSYPVEHADRPAPPDPYDRGA